MARWMGARLIVPALCSLRDGSLVAKPQAPDGVTYAAKLTRDVGKLDWSCPAGVLECLVRLMGQVFVSLFLQYWRH